jgi:hypothetical protein
MRQASSIESDGDLLRAKPFHIPASYDRGSRSVLAAAAQVAGPTVAR